MRTATIGLVCGLLVSSCNSQSDRDLEPRPQTADEYVAAMDTSALTADPLDTPMLLKEQKRLTIQEDLGGQPDGSDINGRPGDPPHMVAELKAAFVAYYSAPFGTLEERRAWRRYMAAIEALSERQDQLPQQGEDNPK